MNIHVGNLSRDITEADLRAEFEPFGKVTTVNIVKDRSSGVPRGFAFIEMAEDAEGEAAIAGLQGKVLKERTMDVSAARPKPTGKGGFGGRGGFRGGGRRRF